MSSCETYQAKPTEQVLPFAMSSRDILRKDLNWSSEDLSLQMAIHKIRNNEAAIANKLDPDIDPYKGYDPMPPKCRNVNRPAKIFNENEGELSSVLQFYSSQDRVLASCPDPNTVIKTLLQMLYCKKDRKLYTIIYFYSENNEWRKSRFAKCH